MKALYNSAGFSSRTESIPVFMIVLIVAMLALPSILFATGGTGHPNLTRGFNPYGTASYGVDSVNLFNGGLGLSIPIGQRFAVSEQLSYQVSLQYGSSSWNIVRDEAGFPWLTDPFIAEPSPLDSAGFGWQSTFGYIVAKNSPLNQTSEWLYVDPQGGNHYFFSNLHEGDPINAGVLYTRDGTYLRGYNEYDEPNQTWHTWLELPNGSRYHFNRTNYDPEGVWQVDGMEDQFGGWVTIQRTLHAYINSPGECIPDLHNPCDTEQVVISDSAGRTHELWYTTPNPVGGSSSPDSATRSGFSRGDGRIWYLKYVNLHSTSINKSCYQLEYQEDVAVTTPAFDVRHEWGIPIEQVNYLTHINIPDGSVNPCSPSTTCTDCSAYEFTYADDSLPLGDDGKIASVTLPTGGQYDYDYGVFQYPDGGDSGQAWGPDGVVLRETMGVVTRTLTDIDDSIATWIYDPEDVNWYDLKSSVYRIVTDPLGNETEYYFNTNAQLVCENCDTTPTLLSGWEYGLPFRSDVVFNLSKQGPESADEGPLALSRHEYDNVGNLLRSVFVRYERDQLPEFTGDPDLDIFRVWQNSNRRMKASSTLYMDDKVDLLARWTVVFNSQFDGLGHYRERTLWSIFGEYDGGNYVIWPDQSVRTTFTGYFSEGGTYPEYIGSFDLNNQNTSYPSWATDREWITFPYDKKVTTFDSEEQESRFDFNMNTGELEAMRILVDDGLSEDDVLVKRARTNVTNGFVTTEKFYGADSQAVSISEAFPLNPGVPEYVRESTVRHGTVEDAGFYNPNNPQALVGGYHVDHVLDPLTGYVDQARDVSGYPIDYEYDSLGRVKKTFSGTNEAKTTAEYTRAYAGNGFSGHAAVRTRNYGPDVSRGLNELLTDSIIVFDGFGRPIRECIERDVSGTWQLMLTEYDTLGRVESSSMPHMVASCMTNPAAVKKTTYVRDRFGRPTVVTAPDGTSTSYSFKGVREVVRTDNLCTVSAANCAGGSFDSVQTTKRYDAYGRLRTVVEPGGEAGAGTLVSKFEYDVGGRLTVASLDDGSIVQYRTFTYDNAGLLVQQTIPELLNQAVSFEHDSLGNVTKQIAYNNEEHTYEFDEATRLVASYWSSPRGVPVELQRWTYYGSTANGWNAHKLFSSVQRNCIEWKCGSEYDSVISEYTYDGVLANVDWQRTMIKPSSKSIPGPSFEMSYTWNALGNLTTMTYPGASSTPAPPNRMLQYTYTNGWPKRVRNITPTLFDLASFTYQDNGMLGTIDHGNGVQTRIGMESTDYMLRPKNVRTEYAQAPSGGPSNWDSGDIFYDGTGNIFAMGTDSFRYDDVGRLATANMTMPDGGLWTYGTDFDAFGNIEALSSVGPGTNETIALNVDHASNRVATAIYDPQGNLSKESSFISADAYSWDPLNRLRRFKGGSQEEFYSYDASGDRVMTVSNSGVVTFTVRDVFRRPVREFAFDTGSGTLAWSRDHMFSGRDAVASEASSVWPNGGQVLFHHRDHLGNLRMLTDPNMVVVAEQAFQPFGTAWASVTASDLQFTGHERDSSSNLDYMHARYFSSDWGRFWSIDPVGGTPGQPQSWNAYAYALGNPLKYFDPWGLEENGENEETDDDESDDDEDDRTFEGEITVTEDAYDILRIIIPIWPVNGDPRPRPTVNPTPWLPTLEDIQRYVVNLAADAQSLPCVLFNHMQGEYSLDFGNGFLGGGFSLNLSAQGLSGYVGGGWGVGAGWAAGGGAAIGNVEGFTITGSMSGGLPATPLGGNLSAAWSPGDGLSTSGLLGRGYGAGTSVTAGYSGTLYSFGSNPCSN